MNFLPKSAMSTGLPDREYKTGARSEKKKRKERKSPKSREWENAILHYLAPRKNAKLINPGIVRICQPLRGGG